MGRRVRRARAGWPALVLAVALGVALAGCSWPASTDDPSEAGLEEYLRLTFDTQRIGTAAGQSITNDGSAAAKITLLSVNKPVSAFEPAPTGGGALTLPPYSGTATGSFAALRIEPASTDWLAVGRDEFRFGADIRLDDRTNGSVIDNGDNVMQRGLAEDPTQFKVQVDKQRASCVLRGSEGSVIVKTPEKLQHGQWYRLDCHRLDDSVTLSVTPLAAEDQTQTYVSEGSIGTLTPATPTPLAVAAKIGAEGRIVTSSTDQFNGQIDNVYFRGPRPTPSS